MTAALVPLACNADHVAVEFKVLQTTSGVNLVSNPSFEEAAPDQASRPASWKPASWGVNSVVFGRVLDDRRSGSYSVSVEVSSWSTGDAKWVFDPIGVTPGKTLVYRDYYKSSVPTKLVAAYQMSDGSTKYVTLRSLLPQMEWSVAAATLKPPVGATRTTVYHLIAAVGTLWIDDVELVSWEDPDLSTGVPNGSLEQAADADPNLPLAWKIGGWGTNRASFSYSATGRAGSRAVSLTLSEHVSGDAKWYFDAQPVTPGSSYQYSDYYRADVPSFVVVQLTMTNGSFKYLNLGQVAASADYTQVRADFLVPEGAVAVSVFHGLSRVGTLEIDDVALLNRSRYQPTPKVVFTFDVSSVALFDVTRPIFAAHGMPAVAFIETAQMNSGESWVMSWQQVRDLQNVYGWEIGSHSINHPNLTTLSDAQLDEELELSKQNLVDQGLRVTTFATPYGAYDLRVLAAAAKYYEAHRAAWGGPNTWPNAFNPLVTRSYELDVHEDGAPTVDDAKRWIDDAISNRQTLVILLHEIVSGVAQMYEFNQSDLNEILDYVATRPIQVTTLSAAWRYSGNPNLVSNPSFTELVDDWAVDWERNDISDVTIDTSNHGNWTGMVASARIVGGAATRELTSAPITVVASAGYLLRMYQNVQVWLAGGWAAYVQEYAVNGSWVNGQWLGGNWANFVGDRYFEYLPSSPVVDHVRIKIYTEANSRLTLYVDGIEFKRVR